ncbi:glycosyltransferase [Algoriphagus sp. SE2]|uniref:glycosyltransferase n=1 Tax=Algoriphagus sp. SE2 TaxID=3141536 RepID=UPI0031CD5C17
MKSLQNQRIDIEISQLLQNALDYNPEIHHQYAIVIPCYNEEKRFAYQEFKTFAQKHPEVLLCLVNDGSKDRTLAVLRGIQTESPGNIVVFDMPQNGGKSEAVRQGMLFVHKNYNSKLIGFLDADLATHPEEWLLMAKYKEAHPKFGAIVGSRIQRLGAEINRDDSRSFASKMIKKIIKSILKANFQDTQCGAKIFQRNLVPFLFKNNFQTPWLFDVEIFLRLQEKFGKTTLQKGVLEYPLLQWSEIGDSRLKLKDTIKIPLQLLGLYYHYQVKKKPKSIMNKKLLTLSIQPN